MSAEALHTQLDIATVLSAYRKTGDGVRTNVLTQESKLDRPFTGSVLFVPNSEVPIDDHTGRLSGVYRGSMTYDVYEADSAAELPGHPFVTCTQADIDGAVRALIAHGYKVLAVPVGGGIDPRLRFQRVCFDLYVQPEGQAEESGVDDAIREVQDGVSVP